MKHSIIKSLGFTVNKMSTKILATPYSSYASFDKSFKLSKPQFSYL